MFCLEVLADENQVTQNFEEIGQILAGLITLCGKDLTYFFDIKKKFNIFVSFLLRKLDIVDMEIVVNFYTIVQIIRLVGK